ncbi:hypothetical protein BJ875DRAFT_54869 [Amylocarpus encephaloides]|uniref:Uncharacterized protein n=1 Tax=Amylocarpus encephaloides TaxID=45428 RepID=A0A9P7YGU1_9HELO|nr:hypothetical protein BJ875DRAFT_54869 [Amylocarpus encephaloides]
MANIILAVQQSYRYSSPAFDFNAIDEPRSVNQCCHGLDPTRDSCLFSAQFTHLIRCHYLCSRSCTRTRACEDFADKEIPKIPPSAISFSLLRFSSSDTSFLRQTMTRLSKETFERHRLGRDFLYNNLSFSLSENGGANQGLFLFLFFFLIFLLILL